MGKHSLPSSRKIAFNKTMAIALAAGVSFGGVQVVGPELGMSIAGEASAAELEQSALTNITLKSDKTGEDLFKQPSPKTTDEARSFVTKQGNKYKLGLDFEIPDSAQPGDKLHINLEDGIDVDGITGNIIAATEAGRKVGHLSVGGSGVTFVVSDDVAEAQNRKAHFDVSVETGFIDYAPTTEKDSLVGTDYDHYVRLLDVNGNEYISWKSTTQYTKSTVHYDLRDKTFDTPLWGRWNDANLNTGTAWGSVSHFDVGMANASYDAKSLDGSEAAILKTTASIDKTAKSPRDVTIRYTVDDPEAKIIYTGAENGKNTINGRTTKFSNKPVKSETATHGYELYTNEGTKPYKSEFKRINDRTVELTVFDIPSDVAVGFWDSDGGVNNIPFYFESPYEPGKTVTMKGTFVNGVGEPASAFDDRYHEDGDKSVTMPSFDGYGSAEDIHRTATMTATINGKDANSKKEAVTVSSGGTGKFAVNIKNTGNIGAGSAVIKFPKGVTDKDGKTEHVVKFPGGLAPGTNKTIDLGELNVPDGANANEFTVEMAGFKTMSDPAWTVTSKTSDSIDPAWSNISVPDGGSKTIKPTGTEKAPKGTKYELTGDHPDWITINPDTGEITAKPPKGTKPGENQVTVKTTFPDGSTDEDKPVITVTHSDIFIDGKPDVKPDGTVTLHRNDGKDITFKVPTGSKVEVNKDGDLVITQPDGKSKTVPLKHTKVEEKGEPGKPGHKIIITDEDGNTHEFDAFDTYIESVERQDNGDYLVTRNDGETWTIKLSDIRNDIKNLKGKDAEQDKRLDDLEKRADGIDEELKNLGDRISKNEGAIEDHRKSIGDLNQAVGDINNELGDIKDELARLDGQDIKEVRDNGDGTYTIIRNNGDEVPGTIGDGQDIKELIPNDDGTMTIIHKDGSESKVDLKQVTITEENQGTPEHTVTITSPNGDSVTFNVFDKYVTNVVKNEDGDYDIFRSDVDGGKTVWKTIILSDLRDKIAALEDRADKLEKKDQALQDEIDELKERMGKAEENIQGLQDKTAGLEDDVRKINAHLSALDLRVSAIDAKLAVLEGRVDSLEDTNKKWAQCYSGIGMAAIPLAIAAPLAGLAGMDIPFLNQANTDIQKRLGVYNPQIAKFWAQNRGIVQAVATVVGLMGAIGAITYAGNQCNPYNKTDDVKDTKLGEMSSKFDSSSSRKEDA